MTSDKPSLQKVVSVVFSLFLVGISFANATEVNGREYGRSLLLSIETDKKSYQSGEAVPLTLRITNKNTNTIWFRKADPYIEVRSESGMMIHGGPIAEPNVPEPSHYYIRRNGKPVYTVPILKIEQGKVLSERIPDALKRYHQYVTEGTYELRARMTVGFFDESEVFVRPDFPNQLWVEPRGGLPQANLESHWVEIAIEEAVKPKRKGLPLVLAGVAAAVVLALCVLIWMLRKTPKAAQ